MKKILPLLLFIFICSASQAQKKNKGKDKNDKEKSTDYAPAEPVADTLTKFTGIIKYYMTTDDPASKDSMFIIFGENRIKVTMFYPGYQEKDIFEDNMIANFRDSTFLIIDNRKKTYKSEKLGAANAGTEISLQNSKKTALILKNVCQEYSGDMTLADGDVFQAAALISKHHSYISVVDYNFMNIQPVVIGYKIVLGYRTKSSDNENTYIMAYKIEPGNVDTYFDLSAYKKL